MRTNAGRITLIQIKLKWWHDCSPPNVVVWITDRSYCRTSPGSSGVQLECLMKPKLIGCIRFLCIARKKKKRKKTTRLPSCGQANKIKESPCGLSLAKQQRSAKNWNTMWIYNKNMGKKNMHLTWICTTEAVLVRTGVGVLSQHDLPSSVTPVKHQLPIGWDQLMNLPLFETAKNDIAILKPPSRRNFSFVWLVPSVFPKP